MVRSGGGCVEVARREFLLQARQSTSVLSDRNRKRCGAGNKGVQRDYTSSKAEGVQERSSEVSLRSSRAWEQWVQ